MEDQEATLNDGSDAVVLFDSSPDSPAPVEATETADSSAETLNTDTAEKGAEAEAAQDESGTEDPAVGQKAEDNLRFDQHPRFKELLTSNKEMQARLAELSAKLESQKPTQEATDFNAEFESLDKQLADGDIDLPEYNKQVRTLLKDQASAERQAAERQAQEQYQARELQDKFLQKRGYISDMLEKRSEDIEALIAADPLHDRVSAAMELRLADIESGQEAAIKEAVEKAVKDTEQKMLANFKAKQSARSLGEGARSAEPDGDALLKDTSKHGGVKAVIADRLKAFRSKAT